MSLVKVSVVKLEVDRVSLDKASPLWSALLTAVCDASLAFWVCAR